MLKKAIFLVIGAMMILTGFGIAQAQDGDEVVIDGLSPVLHYGDWGRTPYVNPGGIGDSLIYGYYNVRGNLNLFNIVNTSSADGVKVRIIFRNAKDSIECLDYSICLSKGDVYTAFLVDSGTTAAVCELDADTLTAPSVPASCQPFKYGGAGGVTGVTADDCREGYFEVIGLSNIPAYDHNASLSVRQGIPMATEANCRDWPPSGYGDDAGNVLMGNNTIFELSNLATYSANAVAVADTALEPVFISPGVEKTIVEAMATSYYNPCSMADFIFAKSNIISPYDLISGIGGETEVVVTFPTRKTCHSSLDGSWLFGSCRETNSPDSICSLFCAPVNITVWNDKENRLDISDFSPSIGRCLTHEVNVVKLGGSQIWNSAVANVVDVSSFDLGWVNIDLVAGLDRGNSVYWYEWYNGEYWVDEYLVSQGLPAIAYTTQSFVGGYASYMLPAAYKTLTYTYSD